MMRLPIRHFGTGWTALALSLAVLVGVLDYVTAPEMSFAVFYLLPVTLAAWKDGLAAGIFVGLASTAIWFQADYMGTQEYSRAWFAYWNTGVRLAFFGLTIFLVNKVRRLTLSLEEKAASLSEQITERERVEKALAENQKVFQLITENASDLITVVDVEGHRRYSSPSYRDYSSGAAAVPGSDFFADVDPADRERVQGVFRRALKTGLNQRAEYRLGHGEQPSRYLESEWSVIRETHGESQTVVVVSRDITLRKRLEMLYANEKDTLEMIARGKPLREVLRSILYKVESWSDQAFCSILVRDAEQNAVWHEASSGLQLPLSMRGEKESQDAPGDGGGDVSASGAAFEREWLSCREHALKTGFQIACEKAILSTAGEALGFLTIYSRAQHNSEMLGVQFFEKIAHVTAIALERQRSEEMLRRLNSLLLEAQETERRRVARELHDSVNQILSSVAFRVQAILPGIAAESDAVKQELVRVHFLLQKAMHEVRSISENLRPSELDELGLIAAVRELCEEFKERNPVTVDFQAPAGTERLSSVIELALYRIVQEALTNIQKHAQASEAVLRLSWNDAWVNLVVRDNGRGSATAAPAATPGRLRFGMGLMDMRERCTLLGGSFSIQSVAASGTEIAVRIPRNPMPQMGLRNG
jgi:PAS domain S-box-containing protein